MRTRRVVGAVGLATALLLATPTTVGAAPGTAAGLDGSCEGSVLSLISAARAAAGVPALREDRSFDEVPRSWSLQMSRSGRLAHNPSYGGALTSRVPSMRSGSEIVGTAVTPQGVHTAFMNSSGHRANILGRSFQRVGVGCARDTRGRIWVTVNFVGATSAIPHRVPAPFMSAGDASARLRWWLLASPPDAARLDSDSARLLSTWSASDLAVYLAASTTHQGLVPGSVRLYGAAFARHPDASGLTYWVQQRQGGRSLTAMASHFASSAEFQRAYGQLGDRAFVERIYQNVLGRPGDAGGIDHWVSRLRAGDSRGKVLVGFSESAEYRRQTAADVTVSWAFAQLVDRMPTAAERSTWTARLRSGTSQDVLVRSLVASHALAQRAARGTY